MMVRQTPDSAQVEGAAEPAPKVFAPLRGGTLGPAAGRGLPLSLVAPGSAVTVRALSGDRELRAHLGSLGLVEGVTVTVHSAVSGNVIVEVLGTRLALDRSLARRVMTD